MRTYDLYVEVWIEMIRAPCCVLRAAWKYDLVFNHDSINKLVLQVLDSQFNLDHNWVSPTIQLLLIVYW